MKRYFFTVLSLLLVCALVFGACANRPELPAEPEATATPVPTAEATAEPTAEPTAGHACAYSDPGADRHARADAGTDRHA